VHLSPKGIVAVRQYRKVHEEYNSHQRVAPQGHIFGMLEPCDGKLSRTVLRGERGGNAPDLPGDR
jgi:hypothetical protein